MRSPREWADSQLRSVMKGVSYRLLASLSTVAISFALTGNGRTATLIGSSEVLAKILLFWGHERVWHRIHWGRRAELSSDAPERVATENDRAQCQPVVR
jgi:uncharacterized membrane protein